MPIAHATSPDGYSECGYFVLLTNVFLGGKPGLFRKPGTCAVSIQ